MTRRHRFASLLATLLGAWGAGRARAAPHPRAAAPPPRRAPAWRTAPGGTCTSYFYDGANRLTAVRREPYTVTTYTYHGPC